MLRFLARSDIDTVAWDACVTASANRILYGYSWYLNAVTDTPSWDWVGLVMIGETNTYRAVMPVPLRRKFVAGIAYDWVVHQPLFCQFLDVFSPDPTVDPTPFLNAVQQRYRYGSSLCLRFNPHLSIGLDEVLDRATHVLDLSVSYETIYLNYTRDRKLNLRRGLHYGWSVIDSTDPEPLLTLFRNHHADDIDGGVGDWAYTILRGLIQTLLKRGLAMIRYARKNDRIEAGALFVREGHRIIYLFNAASEVGRRGNARTLLIHQVIRDNTGHSGANDPLIFDFESPQKTSVVDFYRSFGAMAQPFRDVRWNRLMLIEQTAKWVLSLLR
jgi:Acetyltransferase (GNAT) domain